MAGLHVIATVLPEAAPHTPVLGQQGFVWIVAMGFVLPLSLGALVGGLGCCPGDRILNRPSLWCRPRAQLFAIRSHSVRRREPLHI